MRIMTPVHVRYMCLFDHPAVALIDAACHGDTAWSRADLRAALCVPGCMGWVATVEDGGGHRGEAVIAYCLYTAHPQYVQLERLAVAPGYWRRGVARQLVERLQAMLRTGRRGRTRLVADVPEGRTPAQLLLRALGFLAVGLLADRSGTTAYRFVYDAVEPAEEAVVRFTDN